MEKWVICNYMRATDIVFEVVECNRYGKDGAPNKYDMEKIAWMIETRNRGPKGFVGGQTEIVINPPKKDDD